MKALIAMMVFLGASVSMAEAECPYQYNRVLKCDSTPKAGDEVVAGGAFDTISVCAKGSSYTMIFMKGDEGEAADVKATMMAGGTMYTYEDTDVTITLNVPTGTAKKSVKAKLTTVWTTADLTASSTYTCKR